MAVRNFWLEADIDGRATSLEGGPRAKDGGLSATLKIRDGGGISTALHLSAHAASDGTLTVRVTPDSAVAGRISADGGFGFVIETER
jgi:hypothetical protein